MINLCRPSLESIKGLWATDSGAISSYRSKDGIRAAMAPRRDSSPRYKATAWKGLAMRTVQVQVCYLGCGFGGWSLGKILRGLSTVCRRGLCGEHSNAVQRLAQARQGAARHCSRSNADFIELGGEHLAVTAFKFFLFLYLH